MHLDASNARRYRKTVTVRAFHSANGATYHLPWGDLPYPGPHWVVIQGDGVYGVAEPSFASSYEPVPGRPDTYRKTSLIWARQMPEPFDVMTKEGPERGEAGDWLAQQFDGEQWFVPAETFAASYEPADPER